MEKIFREELVWLDETFKDQEDFFLTVGERLYERGFVKSSFGEALVMREADYPTGLKTMKHELAIPHTDVNHVEKASITYVRFQSPIEFLHMGEPEKKVNAQFAFVLGVKDPKKQVEVLSTLVQLISDETIISQLSQSQSTKVITDTLNHFFEEKMK